MKIVILNNDFRAYWKGRLIFLKQFLSARNLDFYAIELFGKGSPYSFDAYSNSENWWSCLFPDKSADELTKTEIHDAIFSALDKINPDIIIAPSIVFYPGALGIRWAKKNKRKFIMFDDALYGQYKRIAIVQWIKNSIIAQADGLWFPSIEYYTDYSFFHNKGIHFFYGFNCIDNQQFKVRDKKQLDDKSIICVARLVPKKNIDNLLRAWKVVEENETGYRLTIVGQGPEYDNLSRLRNELNLNAVDFCGAIPNDKLAGYYGKADAFILPSLSESWGLVVNEAMAAGLPVLLSYGIPASKNLLQEGVNGFGFNPSSIDNMADAILRYINLDTASKKLMPEKSLEIIDSMSYEKMGVQLTDALVEINKQSFKKPGLIASAMINNWSGRYNTKGWDNV